MAVHKFLMEYLQLTEEDIKDFDILETMTAKSDDELLYVTFSEHEAIREIYRRTAEMKNDEIMTRIYVPPPYWDRYKYISQYCTKLREDNVDIKTQIRFGNDDLEVVIKNRALEDHYSPLPLSDIEAQGQIPKFNHDIAWKKRVDRAPRNAPKVMNNKVVPPSILNRHPDSPPSSETTYPSKRLRKDSTKEKSSSKDIRYKDISEGNKDRDILDKNTVEQRMELSNDEKDDKDEDSL